MARQGNVRSVLKEALTFGGGKAWVLGKTVADGLLA